jgi:hypothetical protein
METLTSSEENTGSVVAEDTLFHLEALLVVTSGNSEDVAFELFTQNVAIYFLAQSSVVEGSATKRVSGFVSGARANPAQAGTRSGQILTCTFHRQFQSFFGHRWWDR